LIQTFGVENNNLENRMSPTYYLFKQKVNSLSANKEIISFSLGDKDVVTKITDGEHAGQKFLDTGVLFIKNSAVKRFNISELDGFYISKEKNDQLERSKLKRGDVLLTTIGNMMGVAAIASQNIENANINQNSVLIRANKNVVNPEYLGCYLNSRIARFQIENLTTGNIYPILTYPKIKSLKIFIKNRSVEAQVAEKMVVAEQYHIDSMNLIKQAQKIVIDSLGITDKVKKQLFYCISYDEFQSDDMWTPAYFSPLYVRTLKQICANVETELLGTLADVASGNEVGSENYVGYLKRKNSDVPFIRTSDFINYDIDRFPDFFVDESIYKELKQDIIEGDTLMTQDGKVGLTSVITRKDKCIMSSGIIRFRARSNKIDPYYLFTALSIKEVGFYQANQRTVIASTIPHMRKDKISDILVPRIKRESEVSLLVSKAFTLRNERKTLIDETLALIETSLN
jgi:type I restriction enzyme, S subunit